MQFPISNLAVPLLYSPFFLDEVESVIVNNVDDDVPGVALFISRLIKGLQNLSNADAEVQMNWGKCSYEIEDIGIVTFRALMDEETGEKVYAIEEIKWTFARSAFFSTFSF